MEMPDEGSMLTWFRAHLDAGGDHVQIQLVTENSAPRPATPEVLLHVYDDDALETYGILAAALGIAQSPHLSAGNRNGDNKTTRISLHRGVGMRFRFDRRSHPEA